MYILWRDEEICGKFTHGLTCITAARLVAVKCWGVW